MLPKMCDTLISHPTQEINNKAIGKIAVIPSTFNSNNKKKNLGKIQFIIFCTYLVKHY
jgi:hypothetical protein